MFGRTRSDLKNTVLACYQCNQYRNDAEQDGKIVVGCKVFPNGHVYYETEINSDFPKEKVLQYRKDLNRKFNPQYPEFTGCK